MRKMEENISRQTTEMESWNLEFWVWGVFVLSSVWTDSLAYVDQNKRRIKSNSSVPALK